MHFAFSSEQLAIRDAVREALASECKPEVVRAAWESPSSQLLPMLADLGVLGVNLPESIDGLGMGATDWVLLAEEAGSAALPESLVEPIAAGPFLVEAGLDELAQRLATGDARISVLFEEGYGLDADRAALVLRVRDGRVEALRSPVCTAQTPLDGSRRLFSVEGDPEPLAGDGEALVDRGVLATSAELLGLTRKVLDMAVDYAKQRTQFGKPIGSFQAVQHHLVDALLSLRFAAPLVYRAAWSLDDGHPQRSLHVSMAKIYASEAARLACRKSLQVHGAIGYTEEFDLQLWMKRIWTLSSAWGDPAWHRDRVATITLGETHA